MNTFALPASKSQSDLPASLVTDADEPPARTAALTPLDLVRRALARHHTTARAMRRSSWTR